MGDGKDIAARAASAAVKAAGGLLPETKKMVRDKIKTAAEPIVAPIEKPAKLENQRTELREQLKSDFNQRSGARGPTVFPNATERYDRRQSKSRKP